MLDLGQLIGQKFGSHQLVVDPKNGDIEEITDVRELTKAFLDETMVGGEDEAGQDENEEGVDEEELKEGDVLEGRDNRNIVDNNQAQKLSHIEIEAMKASGVTGS